MRNEEIISRINFSQKIIIKIVIIKKKLMCLELYKKIKSTHISRVWFTYTINIVNNDNAAKRLFNAFQGLNFTRTDKNINVCFIITLRAVHVKYLPRFCKFTRKFQRYIRFEHNTTCLHTFR